MAGGTTVRPERVWVVLDERGETLAERSYLSSCYFEREHAEQVAAELTARFGDIFDWDETKKYTVREYLLVPIEDGQPLLNVVSGRRLVKEEELKGGPKE